MKYEDGPMRCGGLQHRGCPVDRCLVQCKVCGVYGLHATKQEGLRCFGIQYPELKVTTLDVVRDASGSITELRKR